MAGNIAFIAELRERIQALEDIFKAETEERSGRRQDGKKLKILKLKLKLRLFMGIT